MSEGTNAPQVTRDVEPAALRDLMQAAPRASVAFTAGAAVDLLPARAHFRIDTWMFGVVAAEAPDLEGREVVAAIDDGPYWFELRGLSVRGIARRSEPPSERGWGLGAGGSPEVDEGSELRPAPSPQPPAPSLLTWYIIQPTRVLAWNYGALRKL